MTVGEKWFIFYAIGSILYYLSVIFLAIGLDHTELKDDISRDPTIAILGPAIIVFLGLFSYVMFYAIWFDLSFKTEKARSITRIYKALPFLPVVLLLGLFLL